MLGKTVFGAGQRAIQWTDGVVDMAGIVEAICSASIQTTALKAVRRTSIEAVDRTSVDTDLCARLDPALFTVGLVASDVFAWLLTADDGL